MGTGPGDLELLTPAARQEIEQADIIIGYRTYIEQIRTLFREDQEIIGSSMMQEVDRCKKALDLAEQGKNVALVCGGDPGIYSMAGLVFELQKARNTSVETDVIPGISALNACAAITGSPLMHDFASISLSDLLTPWELIEKRIAAASSADFVLVIYNPASKKRRDHLKRAVDIILEYRRPDTPAAIVQAAFRKEQRAEITTLSGLREASLNMQSTVIIGNSQTMVWNGKMITPRGYGEKYQL